MHTKSIINLAQGPTEVGARNGVTLPIEGGDAGRVRDDSREIGRD